MAKKPYVAMDVQEVEDRLSKLTEEMREIRKELGSGPLHSVEWNFGTFRLFVGKLEAKLKKLQGEWEEQKTIASAKRTRDSRREQLEAPKKKRT